MVGCFCGGCAENKTWQTKTKQKRVQKARERVLNPAERACESGRREQMDGLFFLW